MEVTNFELDRIKSIFARMAKLNSILRLLQFGGDLPKELADFDFGVIAEAMNVIDDYERLVEYDYESVLNILAQSPEIELSPVAKREAGLIDMLLSSSVLGDK